MANVRKWSQTATGNASVAGGANTINFAEGQSPGSVNNSAREMMAQVRGVYTPSEWGWVEHSATASIASQTVFKIPGNHTADYVDGRRWRIKSGSSTRYGSVVSSSYTVETTVTVTVDSGSLSSSHSLVALSPVLPTNHGVPHLGIANTFTANQTINGAPLGLALNSNTDFLPQVQITHAGATASSAAYVILKRARGTYGTPTIISSGDQIGNVLFQGYDGSAYRAVASVEAQVDGTPGASDMPGRLIFLTTPDGSTTATERMRIDNAGNVGVGTTASLGTYGKLRVGGTGYQAINVGSDDASGVNVVLAANSSTEARLNVVSNSPLAVYTNNTERLRVTSAGGVSFGSSGTAYGTTGQVLISQGNAPPVWGSAGYTSLGSITTTSGASQSLSSLVLTSYRFLRLVFNGVSGTGTGNFSVGSFQVTTGSAAGDAWIGMVEIDLATGIATTALAGSAGAGTVRVGNTGYSTATTSVTVSISAGTLDAGSVAVYGVA